jgi:hypothetical protein
MVEDYRDRRQIGTRPIAPRFLEEIHEHSNTREEAGHGDKPRLGSSAGLQPGDLGMTSRKEARRRRIEKTDCKCNGESIGGCNKLNGDWGPAAAHCWLVAPENITRP